MTGRIVVLHNAVGADADADARDVLVQVDEVSAALSALGYAPEALAVTLDLDVLAGEAGLDAGFHAFGADHINV